MANFLGQLLALSITFPLFVYVLVFSIYKKGSKNHRQAIKVAMDSTTFFIILSVHFLIITIVGRSYFWVILLVLIGIAALVVLVHYKWKGEIDFSLILKGFWRVTFLLFSMTTLVLWIVGIVRRLVTVL